MSQHFISFVVALLATATLLACSNDGRIATTSEDTIVQSINTDINQATGVVAVRLEQIQGFFIEGFEIGLRFETTESEVIATVLWSDFVRSQGNPQLGTYYDSVLEQPVPAGDVVVLATVNIGDATPPEIPDLYGDMQCRLEIQVPNQEKVEIELRFSGGNDCLQVL